MTGHLLVSTVTALVALGVVWLLRKRSAAVRFTVLLIALLRFGVPTPWLNDAGAKLAATVTIPREATAARLAANVSAFLAGRDAELPNAEGAPVRLDAVSKASSPGEKASIDWASISGTLWAMGVLVCLALWVRQMRDTLQPVRRPSPGELNALWNANEHFGLRNIELRIVSRGSVPGARGWLRPTVILPDDLEGALTHAELESVVTHELAHVRRADSLWATLAQLVATVFWFHPLVWYLRHRMLVEREIACDDLVMANGAAAEDYATGIAKVCRMSVAPSGMYAHVTGRTAFGSNLKQRLERVLSGNAALSSWKLKMVPALLAVAAVVLPVTSAFLRAQTRPVMSGNAPVLAADGTDGGRNGVTTAALEFLDEEANKADREVEELRQRYSEAHPELQKAMQRADRSHEQLEAARNPPPRSTSAQKSDDEAQNRDGVRNGAMTAALRFLKEEADDADRDVAELRKRFTEEHPAVRKAMQLAGQRHKQLEDALNAPPQSIEAQKLEWNVTALWAQDREDLAEALIREEMAKHPSDPQYIEALLQTLLRVDRLDEAVALYESELPGSPRLWLAATRLWGPLTRAGRWEAAMEVLERTLEVHPDEPILLQFLARTHLGSRRPELAQPIYQRLLEVQPDNFEALNNLASILIEGHGDLNDALALALRAKEAVPESGDDAGQVDDTLGWLYLQLGRPDDAIRAFRNALLQRPDSATYQGRLLAALDQKVNATAEEAELRILLRQTPTSERFDRIAELLRKIE